MLNLGEQDRNLILRLGAVYSVLLGMGVLPWDYRLLNEWELRVTAAAICAPGSQWTDLVGGWMAPEMGLDHHVGSFD